ncbi:hypothetical protein DL89DRAFT_265526 [Linderina pennispora]|uniref:RING-type domain-containing protein n=1 Tax=Linderina pennispora TaxID=61395 RepID=A0A1Y1WE55_9FUNG|nr:uncharacterized protein DL89DRAFT_265526 [Linderina pennispora]ORX71810.1 hypothetical protein DL89DRAFT_265526 [Linderina pennispora]
MSSMSNTFSSGAADFSASQTLPSATSYPVATESMGSGWLSTRQGIIIGVCGVVLITISLVYMSKYTTRSRRTTQAASHGMHTRHITIEMEPRRMQHKLPLLPEHALKMLHAETVKDKQVSDETDPCAICLAEIAYQEVMMELPCRHRFHYDCIRKWLTTKSEQCPLCKGSVLAALGINADTPRHSTDQAAETAAPAEQQSGVAERSTQPEVAVPERAAVRNV